MCPPKTPSNFVTNIILHCRVIFYKFMDITVMFLSTDSLFRLAAIVDHFADSGAHRLRFVF